MSCYQQKHRGYCVKRSIVVTLVKQTVKKKTNTAGTAYPEMESLENGCFTVAYTHPHKTYIIKCSSQIFQRHERS